MKTIVVISGVANTGKSSTLREFASLLLAKYPAYKLIFPTSVALPASTDGRIIVEINNKIIGIEFESKTRTGLHFRLQDLADTHHCDIILCSTRTKGDTMDAVVSLWYRGFQPIWTSTYRVVSNHYLANKKKSIHLLDFLQSLNLFQ